MLSFVYITCRKDPKFEWFVDSLYREVLSENFDPKKIQIVLVDFELQNDESRRDKIKNIIKDRFEYLHVEPKPTPWQGKYRITSKDCWSVSLVRNTGVCYAKYDYIFFIDDIGVITKGSFKHMLEYAKRRLPVAYAYKKVYDLVVDDGEVKSVREVESGIDSRIKQPGEPFRQMSGTQWFGYSSCPLEWIVKINGFDELCNGLGAEDYNFGIRLEKAGAKLYYSKNAMFYESEDYANQGNVFFRSDPFLGDGKYEELMKKYDIKRRWDPNGKKDTSHLMLDLLTRDKYWTDGNDYNLGELRNKVQQTGKFDINIRTDIELIYGGFLKDL